MLNLVRRVSTANSTNGGDPIDEKSRSNSIASAEGDGRRRSSIASFSSRFGEKLAKNKSKDEKGKNKEAEVTSETLGSLGNLFFTLPAELQVQIVENLPIPSLFAVRATCKRFSQLISINQSALVRTVAHLNFPSYALDLYPLPQQTHRYARQHIPHLYRLHHRLVVSEKLAARIAEHIEVEIMRCTTPARKRAFAEDRKRITPKMVQPIFIIYNFYETIREWMLEHAKEPDGEWHMPHEIMAGWTWMLFKRYDGQDLVEANHMHRLIMSTFSRLLRPPTYATGPERMVRWNSTPPSEAALATTMVVGGIDQVKNILTINSYSAKCKGVDNFLKSLSPKNTIKWRRNWAMLASGPFAPSFGIDPPERLRFEEFGAIWSPGCTNFLVDRKILDDEGEVKTQKEYISELLEYDILRGTRWQSIGGQFTTHEEEDDDDDEPDVNDASDADITDHFQSPDYRE